MVGSGTGNAASARGSFVGRKRELAELVSACERAVESDAHLFLVHGEPGIGKTRLADELAAWARAHGMQVLWGRCREGEGAPVYWPWIQIVRAFLSALDDERRRLVLESELTSEILEELARIVPEMRTMQPAARIPNSGKPEPAEARFRLFDSVANFLKVGAGSKPLLIVLDDLHDADEASLAMLRFVARELKGAPIVIVATHRDFEVERSPRLSAMVGGLAQDARTIPLRGLGEPEVRRFVEVAAGHAPTDPLVAKLRNATNGNPLFLDGVVRILIAENAIDSAGSASDRFKIPIGVKEAIRLHLATLSPGTVSLLGIAAAIGKEFNSELCRRAAEVGAEDVRREMEEAARAGIVAVVDRDQYRFAHALIRDALYERLDPDSRVRLHSEIANRLAELPHETGDSHLAELAHHFREAGLVEKAIDYSIRAGKAAAAVFAFADALPELKTALDLMELHGADALQHADLLSFTGTIAFEVDRAAALEFGQSAICLYENLGRLDRAAGVHILLGSIFHMRGEPLTNAALATDHLRQAELAMAQEPETAQRALLYSVIAANECAKLNFAEGASAAQRAMEICDRLGDKVNWPWAAASYADCLCMKGQLSEAFALFDRAFETALETSVSGYSVSGFTVAWRAGLASRSLGDPRGAQRWWERELRRRKKDASPMVFNFLSNWLKMTRFDEGQLLEIGQEFAFEVTARRSWTGGEWEEAAKLMERGVKRCDRKDNQIFAYTECIFAGITNSLIGEHARAEGLFGYGLGEADKGLVVLLEMRARPRLAQLQVEMNRLSEAAEQVSRCQEIMAGGEDWRGLAGGVARADATVEAARGRYDIADRQFEAALTNHRKYYLVWEEAETLQCWGRALAAAGDHAKAAERFDAAIEVYHSLEAAKRFIEYVQADKERALGSSPMRVELGTGRDTGSAKSPVTNVFRKEGDFWTIGYGGTSVRLRDAKGLHYLAYLLAHPGQRIHVLDLIAAVEGVAVEGRVSKQVESEGLNVVRDLGGPGAPLDARARSEYRARLGDLQAELDEAEEMNDLGHIERLRTEIEAVEQELIRSSGLGGRPRARSAHAERARGIVRKNIRAAFEKLRHEDRALARHLSTSISTGYFCTYQPDPPVSWRP